MDYVEKQIITTIMLVFHFQFVIYPIFKTKGHIQTIMLRTAKISVLCYIYKNLGHLVVKRQVNTYSAIDVADERIEQRELWRDAITLFR